MATHSERRAAIINEAQLRANNHGQAFRVYRALGTYAINPATEALPAGEEIAVLRPRLNPFAD